MKKKTMFIIYKILFYLLYVYGIHTYLILMAINKTLQFSSFSRNSIILILSPKDKPPSQHLVLYCFFDSLTITMHKSMLFLYISL